MARPKRFDCEAAISMILTDSHPEWLSRVRSFFDFIGFMKYPEYPKYGKSISAIYTIVYVSRYLSKNNVISLDAREYQSLLEDCANIINEIPGDNVHLEPFIIDELDTVSIVTIVRFLLSYNPKTSKITDKPSLGKAYFVIASGGYGRRYLVKEPDLVRAWSITRAAAAFHYVNMRQSRMLSFRPDAKDFEPRVSALLTHPSQLRRFFAQSLWVQNQLRENLYRVAFRGTTLPTFPANLDEEAVSREQPSERVKEIMEKYSSLR